MPLTRARRKQSGIPTGNGKTTPSSDEEFSRKRRTKKKKILLKDGAKSRSTTRSGREYGTHAVYEEGGKKANRKRSSKSPSQAHQSKKTIRKAQAEEIHRRIASLNMKNRPLPETDNINILSAELKIRLAATSDIIEESSSKRGGKISVNVASRRHRYVPLWDINRQQDATLICLIKVSVNRPKNKPRRNCLHWSRIHIGKTDIIMFTIVKPQTIVKQTRSTNQPQPEVIDHRRGDARYQPEKTWVEDIPYRTLRHQRDNLLESERVYKTQLKELQKEKEELLKLYEPTNEENKQLKSILQHGPDAVKIKKIKKAKRDLETELEGLKNDNKTLSEQMKSLLNASSTETQTTALERQWQTILTGGSKNDHKQIRQRRTQGKHDMSNETKSSDTQTEEGNDTDHDTYDLQLDTVEKEIQILLNNVRQLKTEKKKVDYAVSVRKGALVTNPTLQNAINEKLNKDLQQFKENVKTAQMKSSELKRELEENEIHEKVDVNNFVKRQGSHKSDISNVKTTFNTVETQTDTNLQRAKSDDGLKLHKLRKVPRRTNQSRAIQTEFTKQAPREIIPANVQNVNSKASRKTVSTTKRRIEYADKLLTNRSYNHQHGIEQDRHYDKSGRDGNSTNNQNIQISNKTIAKNIKTPKTTVSKSKEPPRNYLQEKVSEKPYLETDTSKKRPQQHKHEAKVKSKIVRNVAEPTESEEIHDKIMDRNNLPKLRSTGYESQRQNKSNTTKNLQSVTVFRQPRLNSKNVTTSTTKSLKTSLRKEEQAPAPPAIHEIRRRSEIDFHYRNISRADTPMYDIPDFDFIVPHKNGKIHFKGKPVIEMNKLDSNEDAYDDVLSDLMQQYRQYDKYMFDDFKQTLQTYKGQKEFKQKQSKPTAKN